jgi:hypothetical protein
VEGVQQGRIPRHPRPHPHRELVHPDEDRRILGVVGLLAIVPIVNVIFFIIVAIRIGRGFGHGAFFSIVLLLLFAPIGFFIIGFSSDRYTSPA